ncbi:DUF4123 domain-containing protein [Pseudomonas sp. Hp2]|uniref:DUF4123 domain-containing protein n=1 Tax=Pseudomonas sp. Hp2 TaxID=701189 RepID=UPI0011292C2B|nr:DUF4123 domain-containing protein [Pseudomonas sp. Hp2]
MIDIIIKELGQHLQQDPGTQAFLLIDPLLREPFPIDWEPVASAPSWRLPVRHPGIGDEQQPRLIQLEARNVALLEASVIAACKEQQSGQEEAQEGFCIGGWLLAGNAVEGASLASHLASCMRTSVAKTREAKLFRWPDRRVLEWMWPILGEEQRISLLGPLMDWINIDRRSRLQNFRVPNSLADVQEIRLDPAQLQHAERGVIAQDLLRGWGTFVDQLPSDYLHQVTGAVASVCQTGLQNRQDLTLLGAYVLQVHPRLTSHPKVRAAVAQVRQGFETLSEALERIPDPEGWDAIREDLLQERHLTYIEQGKDVQYG